MTVSAVNFLLDEPRIKAISFVGSDHVGHHIWERGTKNGKRVQVRPWQILFLRHK